MKLWLGDRVHGAGRRKAFGMSGIQACEAIAAAMAESGEIWLPRLRFEAMHGTSIERA